MPVAPALVTAVRVSVRLSLATALPDFVMALGAAGFFAGFFLRATGFFAFFVAALGAAGAALAAERFFEATVLVTAAAAAGHQSKEVPSPPSANEKRPPPGTLPFAILSGSMCITDDGAPVFRRGCGALTPKSEKRASVADTGENESAPRDPRLTSALKIATG